VPLRRKSFFLPAFEAKKIEGGRRTNIEKCYMLTAPKYFLAENHPAGKGRGGKAFSKN
jgi:hypothetical protein